MLWNPARLVALGRKPAAQVTLPTIASPVLGMDASLTDRISSAVGSSIPVANLGLVARIDDSFGIAAARWTQATANSRPTLVLSAQNGKPAIRFNGSTQYLEATNAANPGALFQGRNFTLAVVYRRPSLGATHTIFAAGSLAGGEGGMALDHLTLSGRPNGNPALERATGSEYSSALLSYADFPPGALVKVVARSAADGAMEITAKSASGVFTQATYIPNSADLWTWDGAFLGSSMPSVQDTVPPRDAFSGDLFELRFWAARADDATKAALMSFLDTKWGA